MAETKETIFVYDTVQDDGHCFYVSPLPHEYGFTAGLPSEAIMGELTSGPESITPETFKQNPLFLQFLAFVIGKHSPSCPGLIAETKRQQNGYVYIIDRRTPTPDDGVPPEDIVGGVEIANGQMLRFHGSPNYRLLTKHGFMQLDDWLQLRLVEELIAFSNTNTPNSVE